MCFWHFLSNILQEHTQTLLTGLATSFQDTDPAAHSEITGTGICVQLCIFMIILQIYKAGIWFYQQTLMNESMTYSKLVTPKKFLYCQISGRAEFPTQSGGVRESPQLWGLLGSAEFCHQCFRMYCPVPWHQSPNRKPYTGLTPLLRFRERVRIVPEWDNSTAVETTGSFCPCVS